MLIIEIYIIVEVLEYRILDDNKSWDCISGQALDSALLVLY